MRVAGPTLSAREHVEGITILRVQVSEPRKMQIYLSSHQVCTLMHDVLYKRSVNPILASLELCE